MAELPTAGYSQTPLLKKLGIKPGFSLCLVDAPDDFPSLLGPLPEGCTLQTSPLPKVDFLHYFCEQDAGLSARLEELMQCIQRDGMIWISWPKGRSKVPGALTEDKVRDAALPLGLVDIKVCAIDAKWSGLKLVIRKELR
ncbi:MAG: DUF3052 family protein [Bacteroidia bacterium]|nr:DUF3052 family protein [Bacteroidia bacterium]